MLVRKALFGLVLEGMVSCAHAQTAPSPADVGVVHGPIDTFKLLDDSKTWSTFGTVNSNTHVFTPVGGGGGGGGTARRGRAGSVQFNSSGAFGGYANPLPMIINGGTGFDLGPGGVIAGSNVTITGSFSRPKRFPLQAEEAAALRGLPLPCPRLPISAWSRES